MALPGLSISELPGGESRSIVGANMFGVNTAAPFPYRTEPNL